MRILVVGGTSSLALALVPVLGEFATVITAGRSQCDIPLDLNDPLDKYEIPEDIDVIINTAAVTGGRSHDEMLQMEAVNVLGALKLCQLCDREKVGRLVHISSIFSGLGKDSQFYNMYSLSKKHSEEVVQLYSQMFGQSVTILRPSQFYGVGEAYRKNQPFLFSMMDHAENGEDISIYGSHDALRNYIHIEDMAKIIALAIQKNVQGTYSCMNTVDVSYSEVAGAAIEAFGSNSKVNFVKEQADIPDNVFEPDDSLYRLIDYYPQISILKGMEKEASSRKGEK
jgi:nucleoside-diphosphate-sugar epimerase